MIQSVQKKSVQLTCPLCHDQVDRLIFRYHHDSEKTVIDRIRDDHPDWTESDGVCSRCLDYYDIEILRGQRVLPEIGPYFPVKTADDYVVLPTPLRVDTHPRYTGKGVTICFIDSGFSLHPDLVTSRNRIKFRHDFADEVTDSATDRKAAWHGTMTTVVCAGDGHCSHGLYRGIASGADLVLLRVGDSSGHISSLQILEAMQWVENNHQLYGIRILNISLGSDDSGSYRFNEISLLAERLIDQGINIVAAVGNDPTALIRAPANAPRVIAVGGLDDNNCLDPELRGIYHSTFGLTADGFSKPDLLAQAMWIAAPILPGSPEQEEAQALFLLKAAGDAEFTAAWKALHGKIKGLAESSPENELTSLRRQIDQRIGETKYISAHYQHADGTSFAAPIVSAVIAQLLEIEPQLDPRQIRQLLLSTAKRIGSVEANKQGFGQINPRLAIMKALKGYFMNRSIDSPLINTQKRTVDFFVFHESAEKISLVGSFNGWAQDVLLLEPERDGWWSIQIPLLPDGLYQYKFLINSADWMEDFGNPLREPDGFRGFNSLLKINLNPSS